MGTLSGKLRSVGTEIQKFIKNDDVLKNHNLFKWRSRSAGKEYLFEFSFPGSLNTMFRLKEYQEK
jgi:hypothetical protein